MSPEGTGERGDGFSRSPTPPKRPGERGDGAVDEERTRERRTSVGSTEEY